MSAVSSGCGHHLVGVATGGARRKLSVSCALHSDELSSHPLLLPSPFPPCLFPLPPPAPDNTERSNLYLKLFKLVFGSVTIFAQENELMLKVCTESHSILLAAHPTQGH